MSGFIVEGEKQIFVIVEEDKIHFFISLNGTCIYSHWPRWRLHRLLRARFIKTANLHMQQNVKHENRGAVSNLTIFP